MPKQDKFAPGDLVFAKVKGYPPWPARISGLGAGQKFKIFFYGTYETATLKSEDIWFYNEETAEKFGSKYIKKKGYREGLYQIEHTPDIAGFEGGGDGAGIPETICLDDSGASDTSATPSRTASETTSPVKASPPKQKKRKAEDDLISTQPSKKLMLSPTVRLIKPRNLEDLRRTTDSESETESKKSFVISPKKTVDTVEEVEGRKLWVRVKDTDDIIEINLDKDRPDNFPSEEARMEWEMASARKALKFKKKVEIGELVPAEIQKRLEERAKKTPEEREQMIKDRKLERSKEKLRWLKIEQRLVELDIAVKTSLNLKKPSPDRCIQALEELYELGVAPLMLKKQPDIVSTVERLRRYVGPHGYRNWTDEDARMKIERSIKTIQSKSETIFSKFKDCFSTQEEDEEMFLEKFHSDVQEFKEYTRNFDERKVLSMTRDPTKPISRLNPMSDEDD